MIVLPRNKRTGRCIHDGRQVAQVPRQIIDPEEAPQSLAAEWFAGEF
jgi:hypothetical protein